MANSMKHPGGRPPKPASERATAVVHVRVTAARKAAYVAAAKAVGVSLSQWVQDGLDWIAVYDVDMDSPEG